MTVINTKNCKNVVSMFFEQAEAQGERPFLWAKHDGKYRPMSWRETAAQISAIARALRKLGIEKGDRVMLVSENRPEWLISELAIIAAGAIAVPAYTTNTLDDHTHILTNSEASGIIISTAKLAEVALAAAHRSDAVRFAIVMEPVDLKQSLNVEIHNWDALVQRSKSDHLNIIEEAAKLERTETACIIYTSGTGGKPKGVMLSHGAILHNCNGAQHVLHDLGLEKNRFLSFLPLSHSYEHMGGLHFPVSMGSEIYYAEGIETLGVNMGEAHPTFMTAVPRLYETMHARIMRGIEQQGGTKEKLFRKTLELGLKYHEDPKSLTFGERILNALLDKLVRNKIRGRFGGKLKAMISGGAPLNPDIGKFFQALGLTILQGYGLTESAPLISANMPDNVKMHTVGPPVLDTEVRIADDGEILARGELLMNGYWRNEKATREAIVDGWLHTGDIGVLDEDGCLQITDRKKDIIVNSGGDNIAPQRIEGFLTLETEIAQAMVYGDKRSHLVGLIVPDDEWLREWCKSNGKTNDIAQLTNDEELRSAVSEVISRINVNLSNIEKVRKFIIADAAFSIDNEQMTPTMKVRRHKIKEIYGERLESLYV